VLDAENKGKPYLQGWALVENPTDEDWAGVKMALISGRPISFKMDLYNPLFIDRPTVEPELFASLRPVTYRGDFGKEREKFARALTEVQELQKSLDGGEAKGHKAAGLGAQQAAQKQEQAIDKLKLADRKPGEERYARELAVELGKRPDLGAVGNAATAGAL